MVTGGRPTTPTAEALRLQKEWEERGFKDTQDIIDGASDVIATLVGLVRAAEHMAVEMSGRPRPREFQFDGMDHCPSFAIVTEGSDVNIVINPELWSFDSGDEMSKELWAEVIASLHQFHRRKLDERTVHGMASVLRGKLESLVHEGRIVRKPF